MLTGLAAVPAAAQDGGPAVAKQRQTGASLEAGRVLLDQGEPERALEMLRQMLAVDPDNPEAHYLAGLAYIRTRDYERAAEAFRRVTELDPSNVDAHFRLAGIYEFAGRLDEALEEYSRVIQWSAPASAEATEALKKLRYITATQHAKRGNVGAALAMFEELADAYPDDILIIYSLGVAHMLERHMDEAQAAFERVLDLDPGYVNAYLNLATVLEARGRVARAVEKLEKVVALDAEGEAGRKARVRLSIIEARLLMQEGNLQDAVLAYQQALELDPANRVALHALADLYRELRDDEAEIGVYRQIVRLFPDELPARMRLVELHIRGGHLSEAYDQLEEIIQRGRGTRYAARAQELLSRILATDEGRRLEREKTQEKIQALRERLKEDPEDIETRRTLSVLYFQQDMYQEAMRSFEALQTRVPDDPQVHRALAATYDRLGRFGDAVREYAWLVAHEDNPGMARQFSQALQLVNAKRLFVEGDLQLAGREFERILQEDPDNVVAHFYLGMIYTREEDIAGAVDAYKEVIRLVPTHVGARLNLALNYERLNREEEAIDEYRKILQAGPPEDIANTVRIRLEQAQKRIRGLTTGMGYLIAYDSNSNLSDANPIVDFRSDLTFNLAYQYKMASGLRWRFATAPVYSNYHKGQFDFLNTSTTLSATLMPRGYTLVGGYTHRTSAGLLTTSRLSRTDTLFGEALTRFRLPRLSSWDLSDRVFSDVSFNASYTDFDSSSSPFFSSFTTAAGVSMSQQITETATLRLGLNLVINENKELVGSDYAYHSRGLNLGLDRAMPWGGVNLNYGLTFFDYTNPDSFSQFTRRRRNVRNNVAVGATYRFRPDINLFATLSWVDNRSNLPVGFILNSQDVIEGQQSSSLSDYNRLMLTTGINMRF